MNSQEYWQRREEEALKHYITDEAEYNKEINRIYANMLDSCNEQINAFYGRYASKEGITLAEAKKRVSELDIKAYERKAKRYVKDKDFSAKANEEMRLYNATMRINRLELLKANIGLELIAGHDELDKFMSGILKGRTEEELKRQAGILGKTVRNNAQLAHAIPNASFHNATFSDRIWLYQDLMKSDLDKLLQNGLLQGKNPRQLARELEKYVMEDATGGAKYRALTLMQTELARVQTEAQKQSFERNGFDEYTFHANSGCCGDCQALDGKHFKVKDMMPGKNAAPMHPRCRCSSSAYSDRAEYEEWLDFLEKGGTTEEYNKLKAAGKLPKKETKPAAPKAPELPKSIADTEDFEALDKYLEKEYNVSVEKSVKSLDFGSVRSALSGLESVLEKVPGLKSTLKAVKTSKSGIMSCSGENITFNPHYFEKSERIDKACAEQSASRYWVKNATPASIGAHECAHAVEWMMLQKNPALEYEWLRIDAWNKCTEAKKIVSQACKNVKKTEFGKGKRNIELISTISRYAHDTASETMAEAFADVYANGENASPLSLEIERLTLETIKTYEGGESE